MPYEPNRDDFGRSDRENFGRDDRASGYYDASSAREYAAAGELGGRDGYSRDRDEDRPSGQRDYGYRRYDQREQMNRGQRFGGYGSDERYRRDYDDRPSSYYQGSYAHDGRRFTDVDREEGRDRDYGRGGRSYAGYPASQGRDRDQGRSSRDRDDDRGFLARAGDEVRSWFGDEEAERRRERDARLDEQRWSTHHDHDYHNWRQGQIAALDRDYDEYRRENRSKFEREFSSWRTNRQTQRQMLDQVEEHAEVLGSDGQHVGTVDKVRGDRIILTKNDAEAGGHHHSIPSSWLQSVEGGKVTLSKSSIEAKTMWRDEERGAMFRDEDRREDRNDMSDQARDNQGRMLNRSFSGTY